MIRVSSLSSHFDVMRTLLAACNSIIDVIQMLQNDNKNLDIRFAYDFLYKSLFILTKKLIFDFMANLNNKLREN